MNPYLNKDTEQIWQAIESEENREMVIFHSKLVSGPYETYAARHLVNLIYPKIKVDPKPNLDVVDYFTIACKVNFLFNLKEQ